MSLPFKQQESVFYLRKCVCSPAFQLSDRNDQGASGLQLPHFSWAVFCFVCLFLFFKFWLSLSNLSFPVDCTSAQVQSTCTWAWCSEGLEFARNALELFSLKALLLSVEQISTFEGRKKKSFAEQVLNYCLEIRCVPLTAVQRPKCLSPGSEPLSAARGDKQLGIQGSSGPAGDLCIHPQQRPLRRRECPSRGVRLRSPATGLPPLPKQSLNCFPVPLVWG